MSADPMKGITVNGVPLKEEVKEREIIDLVREETAPKGATRVITKFNRPEQTHRVARRVRHLDPRQIRKEYGIMAKPYASNIENALWVAQNKGPISVMDIAKELGISINSISGPFSSVYKALGPNLIVRERTHPQHKNSAFLYTVTQEMSVEALYEKFKAEERAGRKATKRPAPEPEPEPTPKELGIQPIPPEIPNIIFEAGSVNINLTIQFGGNKKEYDDT